MTKKTFDPSEIGGYITAKELARYIPMSPGHLMDRVSRQPDFPKPWRVSRKRFWRTSEVLAWWAKQQEK